MKQKKKMEYKGFNTNYDNSITKLIISIKRKNNIINITIPYKVTAFQLCNYCTYSSYKAGSTNLIIRYNSAILCFNTDRIGFKKLMLGIRFNKPIRILIIGTGGAFKNIFETIKKNKKIKKIYLLNRSKGKYLKLLNSRTREYKGNRKLKLIISTIPINIFERNIPNLNIRDLNSVTSIDISYQKKNIFQSSFKNYLYGETMLYGQAIENLKIKESL
ncbi:hypothetical protein [Candidatus Vidania fulgoroideorum]